MTAHSPSSEQNCAHSPASTINRLGRPIADPSSRRVPFFNACKRRRHWSKVQAMRSIQKLKRLFFVVMMLSMSVPAFAQLNLTGVWGPPRPYEEDEPERGPGPSLVEFLGLP